MTRMKKAGITSLSFCKLVRTGQMSKSTTATDLGGTSWQLVRFQNGDDETLIPDDKSKYTIVFAADGRVSNESTATVDAPRGSLLDPISFPSVRSRLHEQCAHLQRSMITSSRTGNTFTRT